MDYTNRPDLSVGVYAVKEHDGDIAVGVSVAPGFAVEGPGVELHQLDFRDGAAAKDMAWTLNNAYEAGRAAAVSDDDREALRGIVGMVAIVGGPPTDAAVAVMMRLIEGTP